MDQISYEFSPEKINTELFFSPGCKVDGGPLLWIPSHPICSRKARGWEAVGTRGWSSGRRAALGTSNRWGAGRPFVDDEKICQNIIQLNGTGKWVEHKMLSNICVKKPQWNICHAHLIQNTMRHMWHTKQYIIYPIENNFWNAIMWGRNNTHNNTT